MGIPMLSECWHAGKHTANCQVMAMSDENANVTLAYKNKCSLHDWLQTLDYVDGMSTMNAKLHVLMSAHIVSLLKH